MGARRRRTDGYKTLSPISIRAVWNHPTNRADVDVHLSNPLLPTSSFSKSCIDLSAPFASFARLCCLITWQKSLWPTLQSLHRLFLSLAQNDQFLPTQSQDFKRPQSFPTIAQSYSGYWCTCIPTLLAAVSHQSHRAASPHPKLIRAN